jgi:hypothetical protein
MAVYPIHTVLWKFVLTQKLHGQECQNAYHFRNKEELVSDDHLISQTNALDDDWLFRMSGDLLNCQSTQLFWVRTTTTVIVPHNGPFDTTIIQATTGFQPNDSLPSYCAGIVSLGTGLSGRRNRGRLYIAGVPEDQSSNGELDPVLFDAYFNFANSLKANFGPITGSTAYELVLYSHKDGDDAQGKPTIAGAKRLTTIQPRRTLGTQRHRLIGHGT